MKIEKDAWDNGTACRNRAGAKLAHFMHIFSAYLLVSQCAVVENTAVHNPRRDYCEKLCYTLASRMSKLR